MEQIEELKDEARGLTKEVSRLRKAIGRRSFALVGIGAALVVASAYALHVQADNERRITENNARWCPLVTLLVPQPGDPPAATARGRQIAERAADLARSFDCTT